MNARKYIICLAITLYIVSVQVNFGIFQKDIQLLQDENSILANEIKALEIQQEQLESRLKYTVTVRELEPIMQQVEENKTEMSELLMKYKTTDELFIHLFGKAWREP
jgi:hypothetical protein